MSHISDQEARIFADINELLNALDITLGQMADSSNASIGFDPQARAVSQLEKLLKEEAKLYKLHDKAQTGPEPELKSFDQEEACLCEKLDLELGKIEQALVDPEVGDGKLRVYMEQKKSILDRYHQLAGCGI